MLVLHKDQPVLELLASLMQIQLLLPPMSDLDIAEDLAQLSTLAQLLTPIKLELLELQHMQDLQQQPMYLQPQSQLQIHVNSN